MPKQSYNSTYGSVLVFNKPSCCQISSYEGQGPFLLFHFLPVELREWPGIQSQFEKGIEKVPFLTLLIFGLSLGGSIASKNGYGI